MVPKSDLRKLLKEPSLLELSRWEEEMFYNPTPTSLAAYRKRIKEQNPDYEPPRLRLVQP